MSCEGTHSVLDLSSLDCRLQLAEVYDRVQFPPPADDTAEELPSDDVPS